MFHLETWIFCVMYSSVFSVVSLECITFRWSGLSHCKLPSFPQQHKCFVHWPTISCVCNIDASDWDSASTTSKKILPGRRLASPGPEFPECSHHSVKKQDEDDTPTAPQTPQRSIKSPQPAPYPQPRARKMVPQKPESEEGKTFCRFRQNMDMSLKQRIWLQCFSVVFLLCIIQNQIGIQTILSLHPNQPKLTLNSKT